MASFNAPGYPIIIEEQSDNHPQKTFGKEVINRKRTLTSFTNQEPFEPETSSTIKKNVPEDDEFGDEQHDHSKTVLDGKSKNIKTDGKKRIKCQKTPNKLTSKTPLEPGASSAIKNNVPEDDKFLDGRDETDHKIHLNLKSRKPYPPPFRLQPLKKVFDHDHNICVASELGLAYGDLIPGEYAKYFDEEAMVPEKSSAEWELDFNLDYHSFDPCNPWKTPPVEPAGYLLSSSSDDPQSPPSDEDLIGIDS